jgi:hypothetical protein
LLSRDLTRFAVILLSTIAADLEAAVHLRLVPRHGFAVAEVRGSAVMRATTPDAQGAGEPATRTVAFSGDSVALDGPPGSRWHVSLEMDGYWSPSTVVEIPAGDAARQLDVPVWQTATVLVRTRFPDTPPKTIALGAESPPEPSREPEIARGTTFPCAAADDGVTRCTVPAATLDLAFRASGYAPVYRWGVPLSAGKPADLGELQFRKGASVVAWLDRESTRMLEGPARGMLSRMIAPEASQTAARLRAPVAEADFGPNGAVQFVSVPPGTYVITVAAKGFAPARAFPIEVWEGNETALRKPIALDRPMTIRLTVRPPAAPDGGAWRVDLRRANDFAGGHDAERAVQGRVDAGGVIEVPEQTPGRFLATLTDGSGSVYARRDLDIRTRQDADVLVEVPLVPVRGRVLLGEEPLPSDLWFGGRDGMVRVKIAGDDEGTFEGVLPRDGTWPVRVVGRSPKLEAQVAVEVRDEELTVRVPDTTVRGIVVDPGGGPVDQVEITATSFAQGVTLRADSDGSFVFRGLPESAIVFQARDLRTGRRSRGVQSLLKAGSSGEPVELWLEPDKRVAGRVVTRGAPVIGARVTAIALFDETGNAQARTVTNEHGAFELQLPAAARRAQLLVGAPGRTLQNYDVELTGEPLVLELDAVGGTLLLAWPKGDFPVLARAGVPLGVPDLTAWARGQGEVWQGQRLRVPNAAPGPYKLCTMKTVKDENGVARPRCREGTLAPGGTLSLDVGSAGGGS